MGPIIGQYWNEDDILSSPEKFGIPYNLTSVTITSSSQIHYGAFSNCSRIKRIILPKSLEEIGTRAFCNCASLEYIIIPNLVSTIGGWAFYGCDALKEVYIPKGVTTIGSLAFRKENTTIIPDYYLEFENEANIPGTWGNGWPPYPSNIIYNSKRNSALEVKEFGDYGYEITDATESDTFIPLVYNNKFVVSIGDNAFENAKIEELNLKKITHIGNDALKNCI
jgi:hypothetical protein